MNAAELQNLLKELDACEDARKWADGKTLAEAWATCKRSDWMLWLVNNAKTNADDKSLRLIAVKCARQVQHLMTDQRSIDSINVAERYANGEATNEELAAARAAAWAAGAAAWAARTAARAAGAAWAAGAAGAAGAAAGAAAWAAWAAGAVQSDIIREFLPTIEIASK